MIEIKKLNGPFYCDATGVIWMKEDNRYFVIGSLYNIKTNAAAELPKVKEYSHIEFEKHYRVPLID